MFFNDASVGSVVLMGWGWRLIKGATGGIGRSKHA